MQDQPESSIPVLSANPLFGAAIDARGIADERYDFQIYIIFCGRKIGL